MTPKYSPEVLSSISKHRKAVMCLIEKIQVLGQLHSCMSAVGHEFNAPESTMYVQ